MNRRKFNKSIFLASLITGTPLPPLQSNPSNINNEPLKNMRKPKRLKAGDTIALIAPSSSFQNYKFERAVQNLKGLGFKIKFSKNLHAKKGYLAGTDQQRLHDLHEMFADKSVSGIWCLRGGYGVSRILSKIDYSLIKKNPKILIGYSDITALTQAIYLKTGLVCFHGPVASSTFTDYALEHIKTTLMNPQEKLVLNNAIPDESNTDDSYNTYTIRSGKAQGKLIGGNLSLLAALCGTPFQFDAKNKIIFIEDIGEKPYRIDRMLTQLIDATNLHKAAGIILGVCINCNEKGDSQSYQEVLKDRLYDLRIPVISGMSFGHISNQFILPLGVKAEMNTDTQTLTLLEPAVL